MTTWLVVRDATDAIRVPVMVCETVRAKAFPTPRGPVCTITGDDENNVLIGTPGDDVICGLGGNDFIDGHEGNDVLIGGDGDGRDSLVYRSSDAAVTVDLAAGTATGDGEDTVEGFEQVLGSQFDDHLLGSDGDDILFGEHGDDEIVGRGGVDRTGSGRRMRVNLSNDVVLGLPPHQGTGIGDGTDTIRSVENIDGSFLSDIIIGSAGPNKLRGQDKGDIVIGMGGDDVLAGGEGTDVVSFAFAGSSVDVNLSSQDSQGLPRRSARGEGDDIVLTFEKVIGSRLADLIIGSDQPNVLFGGNGADTLLGINADDRIFGEAGHDVLFGGRGDDDLNGGLGADTCDQGPGHGVTISC
jgi:Ca2+-binding RTX toxin-like protein